jgi:hypothetical protein
VGSPLGVRTKAIAVLLLCCVLSLRSVLAYVRSVRASPKGGSGCCLDSLPLSLLVTVCHMKNKNKN